MTVDRRRFLEICAVAGAFPVEAAAPATDRPELVDDVSRLNPVRVSEVRRPRTTDEVQAAVRASPRAVSVGGGRYSMGGQISAADSLHLDMRSLNGVVRFDARARRIRVQAGMTWRDVQDVIDPHDLSVKVMQSFSNFTVGGSVSVNCHGRYVGRGPIVNTVRALQLVTAHGEALELTRSNESELFDAVIGGYGGLGVITEVELELDDNKRVERWVQDVPLEQYPSFFRQSILADGQVVLHNADLSPPDFAIPRAISWRTSEAPLTQADRLVPRGLRYGLEQNALWAITELPGGSRLRDRIADRVLLQQKVVKPLNLEASLDVALLEPRTRGVSTYLLQEYFVPPQHFVSFARRMARILTARSVNALNVSIRHTPGDNVSLLKWAPTEVFSFVLYYKQRSSRRASDESAVWTRELIDAVLAHEGRYYLPYRLDATPAQFLRAYPEARDFARVKARVDPRNRFRNALWTKYLPVT